MAYVVMGDLFLRQLPAYPIQGFLLPVDKHTFFKGQIPDLKHDAHLNPFLL